MDEAGNFAVAGVKFLNSLFEIVKVIDFDPYMLDTENEGVHRIRAVVKDEDGFSYI